MKINHAIRTLILSDFIINSGFSIFGPVFAIFITKQIEGGSIEIVGFAAAITQIIKAVLQIPIAHFLDKNHGEYDDFYSMVGGHVLISCVPFMYVYATTPAHIYIIQAIQGIGLAMAIPPWNAIFTRHIDKMQENIEWSLESVGIGAAVAGAAALGGILAQRYGFHLVFILGSILALTGTFIQAGIYKDLKIRVAQGQVKPEPPHPSHN